MTQDLSESPALVGLKNVRIFKGCSTLWIASDGPFRYGRVKVVSPSVSDGEVGHGLGRQLE